MASYKCHNSWVLLIVVLAAQDSCLQYPSQHQLKFRINEEICPLSLICSFITTPVRVWGRFWYYFTDSGTINHEYNQACWVRSILLKPQRQQQMASEWIALLEAIAGTFGDARYFSVLKWQFSILSRRPTNSRTCDSQHSNNWVVNGLLHSWPPIVSSGGTRDQGRQFGQITS